MVRRWRIVAARFRALVGREAASLRQGSVALLISVAATLLAGLTLGAITDTLEDLPGLLLLIPAAVALRGNIGGALAGRLGTAIHAGTFVPSRRMDTLFGQNLVAAAALSLTMSFVLALIAKGAAVVFEVPSAISVADYVAISVLGGLLASVLVVTATVAVADLSARRGWDLDNVAAPIVTATGDLVTVPALWLVSGLARVDVVTPAIAWIVGVAAVGALVASGRSRLDLVRAIVRQSVPILAVAGAVSIVAGVTVEKQLDRLSAFPALLILIPPFLGSSGALGGMFSSRIATKLHLGLVEPARFRLVAIAEDLLLVAGLAFPLFLLVGIGADVLGRATDLAGPGLGDVVGATVLAGVLATTAVVVVGYAGTVAAFRLGRDPDNYAIPVVTSTLDLVGAVALILSLALVGVL